MLIIIAREHYFVLNIVFCVETCILSMLARVNDVLHRTLYEITLVVYSSIITVIKQVCADTCAHHMYAKVRIVPNGA